jgi:hypothetical protein
MPLGDPSCLGFTTNPRVTSKLDELQGLNYGLVELYIGTSSSFLPKGCVFELAEWEIISFGVSTMEGERVLKDKI